MRGVILELKRCLRRFFPRIYRMLFVVWNVCFVEWPCILLLRYRYAYQCKRIHQKLGKEKIRVLFLVGNISKWKLQSLYKIMAQSEEFEPIVAVTVMDIEISEEESVRLKRISELHDYFNKHNVNFIDAYLSGGKWLPLREFHPDIVFYTLSGRVADSQSVMETSKAALTCYVPYFVQNYGYLPMDCECRIHRYVWRHFTLNEIWAKVFMDDQGTRRAGKVIGTGHPMLDQFNVKDADDAEENLIVYAPHFSCNVMECYSTFLQFGKLMLDFAKSHPEMKWVFKPHPTLWHTLVNSCGWTNQQVAKYYNEWEKFSIPCYNCDYVELFEKSKVMITDCASFLVEYACTKKPIIHLISGNAKIKPHSIAKSLFDTYYKVRSWDDFLDAFKCVVLEGNDPMRADRIGMVEKMNLIGSSAAEAISCYLSSEMIKCE